jgi:hypothetical protein
MIQQSIKVNGIKMNLKPYSEKGMKGLNAINTEITEWVNKNLEATIDQVPIELKGDWWKRKASILWDAEKPLPDDFFTSDEFESSLLKDSEEFFTMKRLYL